VAVVAGYNEHRRGVLSRESEIFGLCCYFFDPIFYEANESSSACRPHSDEQVETKYAPVKQRMPCCSPTVKFRRAAFGVDLPSLLG
jgi:hypothetical protein